MAYASPIHVQQFTNRRFTATSAPTATALAGLIDRASEELDGIVAGLGHALPIPTTATVSLGVLRSANAVGGWYYAELAAPASDDLDNARREWEARQKSLRDGDTLLPDAPKDSAVAFARAPAVASPWFSREMDLLWEEPPDYGQLRSPESRW